MSSFKVIALQTRVFTMHPDNPDATVDDILKVIQKERPDLTVVDITKVEETENEQHK
jgi:hypothetical protein